MGSNWGEFTTGLARVFALIAVALGLTVGCERSPEPAAAAAEPQWGLGSKADDLCAPEEQLCWDGTDSATMTAMLAAQDQLVFGDDPNAALADVFEYAWGLAHKLNEHELAGLAAYEEELEGIEPGDYEDCFSLLHALNGGPLERVVGSYYVAYMVPVGRALAAHESGEKFDDTDSGAPGLDEVPGATDEMAHSLEMLRDTGPLGELLIGMYRVSGVLEPDYAVVNAKAFGEYDPATGDIVPSGMSREAKVEEIMRRYKWSAAGIGAASGLVSSIPVAGVAIAIPGELFYLWRLHTKMAFRIGAVYGWDIRKDRELYDLSMMILVGDSLKEGGRVLTSYLVIPMLLKRIAPHFGGFQISNVVLRKLAFRPLALLIDNILMKKGQSFLVKAGANGTLKSLAGQLLPIAGAAVNVSIGAISNWVVTDKLGERVHTMSRDWLSGLMFEGSTYLADRRARDCGFRALAAVAWADDRIDDREARLFMAFLAKPYAHDEQGWFDLSPQERLQQSQMLATWRQEDSVGDVEHCLEDEFESSKPPHRMSLLGHLYAMAQIDVEEHADERDLYEDLRDHMDGDGWFLDGEEIDEAQLVYMERAIFLQLNPHTMDTDRDMQDMLEAITPEDVLDFLAEPDPEVEASFECGFAGNC